MNKFFFQGEGVNSWYWSEFCTGGHCYFGFNIDVVILYGNYIGCDNPTAIRPLNLPPLTGAKFNAKVCRFINGNPGPVDSTPTLINEVPVYSPTNLADCIGTKYTFATRLYMDDCSSNYGIVWSTGIIEMAYGADIISIAPLSGVGFQQSPCD
jgi:hypothetical protein